jgi:hypothetical protein
MISYLSPWVSPVTRHPKGVTQIVDLAPADIIIKPVNRARLPASGYGRRIPTQYMVKYAGRWRRVYCYQFSNAGTAYIGQWRQPLAIVN